MEKERQRPLPASAFLNVLNTERLALGTFLRVTIHDPQYPSHVSLLATCRYRFYCHPQN